MEPLIFGLFLFTYLVTILGNLLIIFAVSSEANLQTPMYLFLSKLSFTDICLSTTTVPNMLKNIHTQDQSISYMGCLTQACFVLNFAVLESCVLAAMAYDRYAAICHPLNYTAIMNPKFCGIVINLIRFIINMKPGNETSISYFFLLKLTNDATMEPLIFGLFLFTYLVTILGNLLIIFAVSSEANLQTPMYLFLSKLSFTDICLSTTTVPNMLKNIHTQDQSISYMGCLTQACFVLNFAVLESCVLAAMAYDRYAAICHPLNYTAIMNPKFCVFGNILVILAVSSDSHLHTPMYFFIANLSFTDICISTTIIPKMLVNIQTQDQSISYAGCLSQLQCAPRCLGVCVPTDDEQAIGLEREIMIATEKGLAPYNILPPKLDLGIKDDSNLVPSTINK
ncbi:hypothetical protein ACRRTK_004126 [Alexandromys fortis]